MKKQVDPFTYAGTICKALPRGILLTTCENQRVNTMTIGWGHIGIEWNRPVFIAFVRKSRYTRQLLDRTGAFTVNVPVDASDSRVLRYCGTKSGRDTDKLRDLGLTTVESDVIDVPGIREFPLTLECRVIYRQEQEENAIPSEVLSRFYPLEADGARDIHIAYYGEIVNAYLLEED